MLVQLAPLECLFSALVLQALETADQSRSDPAFLQMVGVELLQFLSVVATAVSAVPSVSMPAQPL
jgi:hypothetical protein